MKPEEKVVELLKKHQLKLNNHRVLYGRSHCSTDCRRAGSFGGV